MSGAAASDSSSRASDSDQSSSKPSESESESESGKCDKEAEPAASSGDEAEDANGAGASGAGASARPPESDAVSEDLPTKKRNRNSEKWLLLKEWDAAPDAVQADQELIHGEKLEIVTDINHDKCCRWSGQISCSQRPH